MSRDRDAVRRRRDLASVSGLRFTPHAVGRIAERDLDLEVVAAAIEGAALRRPSDRGCVEHVGIAIVGGRRTWIVAIVDPRPRDGGDPVVVTAYAR